MTSGLKQLSIGVCAVLALGFAAWPAGIASAAAGGLVPVSYTNTIERNWRQEKDAAGEPVVYRDLRNGMMPDRAVSSANLEMRYSSGSLIGAYVHTRDGTQIARITDVILDTFGNAQNVTMAGEWPYDLGGNPVIMDYESVVDVSAPSNASSVIKPVGTDRLKAAAAYSGQPGYNEVAVSLLAGADVKDSTGNPVARVENVSFSRKAEAYFVLSYGQGLDSGRALMAYKDVQKVFPGKGAYLQLTQEQTDYFKKNLLKTYSAPQTISGVPPSPAAGF